MANLLMTKRFRRDVLWLQRTGGKRPAAGAGNLAVKMALPGAVPRAGKRCGK